MFDLFFYYKNYNRYVHILKYSKNRFHFLNILKMQKISLFFDIKQLTDINNQSILSCIFFFKYYFGIIPFFKNYKHEFKLNIHYFSFVIEYSFYNKIMYYVLYYFINDIYFMINKMYLLNSKFKNYWEFIVNDMNFFIEKKNSLGFFNLKHKLIIQMYVTNTQNWDLNLLNTYKLKYE
jgi:hypothetical protein